MMISPIFQSKMTTIEEKLVETRVLCGRKAATKSTMICVDAKSDYTVKSGADRDTVVDKDDIRQNEGNDECFKVGNCRVVD